MCAHVYIYINAYFILHISLIYKIYIIYTHYITNRHIKSNQKNTARKKTLHGARQYISTSWYNTCAGSWTLHGKASLQILQKGTANHEYLPFLKLGHGGGKRGIKDPRLSPCSYESSVPESQDITSSENWATTSLGLRYSCHRTRSKQLHALPTNWESLELTGASEEPFVWTWSKKHNQRSNTPRKPLFCRTCQRIQYMPPATPPAIACIPPGVSTCESSASMAGIQDPRPSTGHPVVSCQPLPAWIFRGTKLWARPSPSGLVVHWLPATGWCQSLHPDCDMIVICALYIWAPYYPAAGWLKLKQSRRSDENLSCKYRSTPWARMMLSSWGYRRFSAVQRPVKHVGNLPTHSSFGLPVLGIDKLHWHRWFQSVDDHGVWARQFGKHLLRLVPQVRFHNRIALGRWHFSTERCWKYIFNYFQQLRQLPQWLQKQRACWQFQFLSSSLGSHHGLSKLPVSKPSRFRTSKCHSCCCQGTRETAAATDCTMLWMQASAVTAPSGAESRITPWCPRLWSLVEVDPFF